MQVRFKPPEPLEILLGSPFYKLWRSRRKEAFPSPSRGACPGSCWSCRLSPGLALLQEVGSSPPLGSGDKVVLLLWSADSWRWGRQNTLSAVGEGQGERPEGEGRKEAEIPERRVREEGGGRKEEAGEREGGRTGWKDAVGRRWGTGLGEG